MLKWRNASIGKLRPKIRDERVNDSPGADDKL